MRLSSAVALKMDASIAFSTSSSLLRSFRPLLISQSVSFRHRSRQRISRRLCAASSEPPLMRSHSASKERRPEQESVEDNSAAGSTSALQSRVVLETTSVELKSTSSIVSNDAAFRDGEASALGRRRKRRQFVAKVPKRLHSDEEDLGFMREALAEARKGAKKGEVPVGAVLVHNKKIIARFHNQVEAIGDPTAHAEMLCIRSAAAQLGGWRLTDVSMYVTLEPCPMCAGAILQGRVSELVWGARNSLLGADGSWIKLFPVSSPGESEPEGKDSLHPFHKTITVRRGVLAEESAEIMQSFFAMRRLPPKCRIVDAHVGVKSLGALRKLNSWVRRWFQF